MTNLYVLRRSLEILLAAILSSLLLPAHASAASLSLAPGQWSSSTQVTINWSATNLASGAWIGVYVPGDEDTGNQTSKSISGTSGTVTFGLLANGNYEARLFGDGGYSLTLASISFGVAPPTGSLSLSSTSVKVGDSVAVAWQSQPGITADGWVGLFAQGASDTSYLLYKPVTAGTAGTLQFTAPTTAGNYELRLFADFGYAARIGTVAFSVATASDTLAPAAPTGLKAVVISSSWIDLNWTSSTDNVGVSEYRIYRTVYNNCISTTTTACAAWYSSTVLLTTVTSMPPANSFSDTSTSAGTKYDYTVKACDVAGNCSGDSIAASVTTPPATYNLVVTTTGNGYGNVASSPAGISCYVPVPGRYYLIAADCSESYAAGLTVTLTATPDNGSTFAGWGGSCAGTSSTCALSISAAASATANFAKAVAQPDCLFDWVERTNPQAFSPSGVASKTLAQYYYRYYRDQEAYLGVSYADQNAYYLGPLSGYQLANLGSASGWYATAGCAPPEPLLLSFTQETVGSRANLVFNGAWWGENISKIVHHGSNTFTYVIDASVIPTKAFLYGKSAEGAWTEGEGFEVSRPPNLLVDSAGVIHLIGFAPYDAAANDSAGRLFHVEFAASGIVSGAYFKEFISEDWRPKPATATYSTYYVGAAIGADDTIAVAYNNSVQWNTPNTHTLGFRVRSPQSQTWTYETVAENMASRHCYPFAYVSPGYFHVYAVEDDFDPDFAALGEPYASYQFRYGMVKHFQRPRSGGPWVETTLLDFNGNSGISKAQIWDAQLRIVDFHVDAAGTVHALLRYKGTFNGSTLIAGTANKAYHYWKAEDSTTWSNEEILPSQELYWARIWERSDGKLFFVGQTLRNQLWVIPHGETTKYTISSFSGDDMVSPTPFISSLRGGTDLSTNFQAVVFSGKYSVPAKSLDVLVEGR